MVRCSFVTRSIRTLVLANVLGLALAASPARSASIPTKPEAGTIKMGLEPWLGYGMWYVCAKKGLFEKEGLSKVELVNFTEDKDLNAALASGRLDVANVATHTAMAMIAAGLPVKAIMLEDFSLSADAILAGKTVKSVNDLKGKQIAFEEGTTSNILLSYALSQNGMSISDVKPVPMPAADAGGALIAGRVPVAVTYEPYISTARKKDKDLSLLFTAGKDPGLISDVLVAREEVLKTKPGQILALVKSWGLALKDYRANMADDRKIIADGVGSTPADLESAFEGVRFYSLDEGRKAFGGDFKNKTFANVLKAAKQAKLITKDVTSSQMIDADFINAAK